jgi:hypothetical protein
MNLSSYMILQQNPFVVFAVLCGTVMVGSMVMKRWGRGLRIKTALLSLLAGLIFSVAALMTLPEEPWAVVASPYDSDLRLLVSRDRAFLDPSAVITVQHLDGIWSQEWYLTCKSGAGVPSAAWINETKAAVTLWKDHTDTFEINPQTGEPRSTGSCSFSSDGQRPGPRSPQRRIE